jgi:hypothetical protein
LEILILVTTRHIEYSYSLAIPNVVGVLAASASLEDLLEVQNFRPHLRNPDSDSILTRSLWHTHES